MKMIWILISVCSMGSSSISWQGDSKKACDLIQQGLTEENPKVKFTCVGLETPPVKGQ